MRYHFPTSQNPANAFDDGEIRHTYKGWTWVQTVYGGGMDRADSPWHTAYHEDGREVVMQFSSRERFEPRHFEILVDHDLVGKQYHHDTGLGVPWWTAAIEALELDCAA